jgi:hypothetical protein
MFIKKYGSRTTLGWFSPVVKETTPCRSLVAPNSKWTFFVDDIKMISPVAALVLGVLPAQAMFQMGASF